MKPFAPFALVIVVLTGGCTTSTTREPGVDISRHFERYQGCFVMHELSADDWVRYDPAQCARRLSPCSTFKIPNSLIGLETEVVKGADFVIPWDRVVRDREETNRDHDLRSAIKHSVVWYYQEVARRVGKEKMQHHVAAIPYGNEDLSGGLTRFWLESTLAISAEEQVQFLERLHRAELPFSPRSIDIVKEILMLEQDGEHVYRGKTGSGNDLGWFVGWVVRGPKTHVFATNIEGDGARGSEARRITESILREFDVL